MSGLDFRPWLKPTAGKSFLQPCFALGGDAIRTRTLRKVWDGNFERCRNPVTVANHTASIVEFLEDFCTWRCPGRGTSWTITEELFESIASAESDTDCSAELSEEAGIGHIRHGRPRLNHGHEDLPKIRKVPPYGTGARILRSRRTIFVKAGPMGPPPA